MLSRVCNRCTKKFQPSSRHLACPKCRRSAIPRRPCPGCGRQIRRDRKSCLKCAPKGSRNGAWKGGRTYHKKGYVMLRVPGRGYVFEHVLVMEKRLGRRLEPGETVHHKNGVRSDNRSRNLELWRKAQPAGARVSDLLFWAKEILEKYEGVPV